MGRIVMIDEAQLKYHGAAFWSTLLKQVPVELLNVRLIISATHALTEVPKRHLQWDIRR